MTLHDITCITCHYMHNKMLMVVCFEPHIVGSLHHIVCDIAYDIAYDVSFVSNSGFRMACPDQRFICRFVFRLLYHWHPASLLQQPDSIATPCFPIPPRLASAPITGLPCNFFRGSPGCNPAPPPGAAAPHAEYCSMLCHCAATTGGPPLLRVRSRQRTA